MILIERVLKKSRGVSPVIATVLLIGLTVIAGLAVALVIFGTINTPEPLKIEIISISDFRTTDNDINIDQFSVTVQNKERTNVRIESNSFTVKLAPTQTEIPGWGLNADYEEILLPALAIQTFSLVCDPTINQAELIPGTDSIYIEVTVFPEDSTNQRDARIFKSDLLRIGDTIGPVILTPQLGTTNMGSSGLYLNFSITNNGSTDLDLIIEFSTDSSEKILFIKNGINQTRDSLFLPKFMTKIFDFFTIKPTTEATIDDKYIIYVTVQNQANLEYVSFTVLILTYVG